MAPTRFLNREYDRTWLFRYPWAWRSAGYRRITGEHATPRLAARQLGLPRSGSGPAE